MLWKLNQFDLIDFLLEALEVYITSIPKTIWNFDFRVMWWAQWYLVMLYFDIFGDARSNCEGTIAKYFKMVVIGDKDLVVAWFVGYIFQIKFDEIFGGVKLDIFGTYCESIAIFLHFSMI